MASKHVQIQTCLAEPTLYMQKRKLPLAQCQESLNMLIQDVEEGRNDQNFVMHCCPSGKNYISDDAEFLHDPLFESGVCKIQNGTTELMTVGEKEACKSLLVNDDGNSSGSDQEEEIDYEERLRQRKQQRENPLGYMNCDFILGSAAEVERLWSIATNVLTDERKKMSPLMLEAVLFLRVNSRLWDVQTVKQALHMSWNEQIDKKIEEDENAQDT